MKTVLRLLLGFTLLFAGISHLTFAREALAAQVPEWMPMNADLVIVLSGIVEICLGLALIVLKKYRPHLGVITALFFIAVFPGNIAQYVNQKDAFGLNSDTSRLVRLFFQPVLVAWAIYATNAWTIFRRTKSS